LLFSSLLASLLGAPSLPTLGVTNECTMTDVRSWLADMGLERFAEAFEREEIALEHVPELQESDLETLGLPMGPRKAV